MTTAWFSHQILALSRQDWQDELLCHIQKFSYTLMCYWKTIHSYCAIDCYCYYQYDYCCYYVFWGINNKLIFEMEKLKFLEMFYYSQITLAFVVSQVPLVL